MTRLQDPVVAGILEQVHQQLSPTSFDVWFRDSTQMDLADKELVVGVPNVFVCEYMESRFRDMIATIARQRIGNDASVRFQIEPRLFQRRRQAALAQSQEFLESEPVPESPPGPRSDPAEAQVASKEEVVPPQLAARPCRPEHQRAGDENRDRAALLTLDRFVVGNCNRMAYAAALEVVHRPGKAFNPLFIHGACGLGKTHLLQAIVHAVGQEHRSAQVLYITAEQFTNRYIMAVKTRSLDAFRSRFRSLDLLVIDDIHFLANKQATQEEFLHTFNAFHLGSRQVVMASDSHPKNLESIQQNLINRFVSGMVAHLLPPDRGTRAEILRRKATQMGIAVADDVLTFAAQHAAGSIRELEGALIRIVALAALDKQPVTMALAREALADHVAAGQRMVGIDAIVGTVSQFFGVSRADLLGRKRTRTVTLPRQTAMFLARKLTPLSLPEIGRLMGGKNHTTILAACRRVDNMLRRNEPVAWHDGAATRRMTATELVQSIEDRLHA